MRKILAFVVLTLVLLPSATFGKGQRRIGDPSNKPPQDQGPAESQCQQVWDKAERNYIFGGPMAWWLSYADAMRTCPRAEYIQAEQYCMMSDWMFDSDQDCMNEVLGF